MFDALGRLLGFRSERYPILSVYLDTRVTAAGMRGGRRWRPYSAFLRPRLQELSRAVPEHGPVREAFTEDVRRLHHYLDNELQTATQGLALFISQGANLFEAVQAEEPFANQVSLESQPLLYPLLRYLDHSVTCAVLAADSERARIYTVRAAHRRVAPQLSHTPERPERAGRSARPGFGASELKYQRYLRQQVQDYHKELVAALQDTMQRESIPHLVLWGPDRTVAELRGLLPASLAERVVDSVRESPEAPAGDLLRTTLERLRARLEESRRDRVEELLEESQGSGLAVAGLESTLEALYWGQVEELVMLADCRPLGRMCPACQRPALAGSQCPDCQGPLGPVEDLREELVRQAARSGAHLEFVEQSAALASREGLAASLRYR